MLIMRALVTALNIDRQLFKTQTHYKRQYLVSRNNLPKERSIALHLVKLNINLKYWESMRYSFLGTFRKFHRPTVNRFGDIAGKYEEGVDLTLPHPPPNWKN